MIAKRPVVHVVPLNRTPPLYSSSNLSSRLRQVENQYNFHISKLYLRRLHASFRGLVVLTDIFGVLPCGRLISVK